MADLSTAPADERIRSCQRRGVPACATPAVGMKVAEAPAGHVPPTPSTVHVPFSPMIRAGSAVLGMNPLSTRTRICVVVATLPRVVFW